MYNVIGTFTVVHYIIMKGIHYTVYIAALVCGFRNASMPCLHSVVSQLYAGRLTVKVVTAHSTPLAAAVYLQVA